ncbi:uncharacterized protein [Physcomitrium patens]|uniref:DUF7953 domain-containing protein n=1 Tax=Physcomitrium patens TaxID=3218 RepID=A9SCK8_PHYPA|nr:uncharacterized protein LOC112294127 [Physcomitrium patens]PNR36547.1 hypothetical protein PHYPA_022398 [Physcomitrium patens]|eukprot:XP_024400088.1 uncharacterized protein LOC112294127 [Physcomitrella patens]
MAMEWCRILLVPVCLLSLLSASGVKADGNVTLHSLTIFSTHEWFGAKPEVYFQCQGEDVVHLPDVEVKGQLYKFSGQESWQPLTTLVGKKCKLCGLFEKDMLKDDKFDQWELCPSDFNSNSDGAYFRLKEKEFNLTLSCPDCNIVESGIPYGVAADPEFTNEPEKNRTHHGWTAVIVVFSLLSLAGCAFVAYSQWRRKQRELQQARFIKLFEDDDFLDEELGLKDGL